MTGLESSAQVNGGSFPRWALMPASNLIFVFIPAGAAYLPAVMVNTSLYRVLVEPCFTFAMPVLEVSVDRWWRCLARAHPGAKTRRTTHSVRRCRRPMAAQWLWREHDRARSEGET